MAKETIELDDDGGVIVHDARFNRRRPPERAAGERRREFEGQVKKVGKGILGYLFSEHDSAEDAVKGALKDIDDE
jgi:hypothetical protein